MEAILHCEFFFRLVSLGGTKIPERNSSQVQLETRGWKDDFEVSI